LEKVGYFLKNSEERMQVAARGRKAALEKMTFGALMERTLKEVARRLEKAGICLSE
jgi:N6-adenosine-specific RNA methylase IME4